MIRSMTGFGEAERDTAAGRLRAEVRTVNHRFFSVNLRLARPVERYEGQVREWLRSRLPRGHVNFSLRIEANGLPAGTGVQVDLERARQYVDALRTLQSVLGLSGEIDIRLLSRFQDLIVLEDESEGIEVDPEDVRLVTEAAADATVRMREEEGHRLAADLEERLVAIEVAMRSIEEAAPARVVAERDRMRRVVTELLEGQPIDEDRVAREIALIAERWDISEELVRLRSHLALFRETVAADASEPVGKRLSFLIQEMHRETNTIGAKANDAAIEHRVIAIKDEIERLREQVENVE
ncbi:MAG: YicC family protein [Candidatus Cloacimonetes bacterium]|nr:YicC family protein [Candidatus Cloacimonadota bacterium]